MRGGVRVTARRAGRGPPGSRACSPGSPGRPLPGAGQAGGARPLGRGQVTGLDQHGRQGVAARPGHRAVQAGRMRSAWWPAARRRRGRRRPGGHAEDRQRQRLATRRCRPGTAPATGGRRRPPRRPGPCPATWRTGRSGRWPAAGPARGRQGVADRGEVAQRPGRIGRIQRRLAEPGVATHHASLPAAARPTAARSSGAWPAAGPELPPRRQRGR